MEAASDKEQSTLFKVIHEDPFGPFGRVPYGLLIGDYAFGRSPKDIAWLTQMSKVAAAGPTPFIAAASADLFGLNSFHDLNKPRDLSKLFDSVDLADWQAFRATKDSRFISLVLPHALLRMPYGKNGEPVEGIAFEETWGHRPLCPTPSAFYGGMITDCP